MRARVVLVACVVAAGLPVDVRAEPPAVTATCGDPLPPQVWGRPPLAEGDLDVFTAVLGRAMAQGRAEARQAGLLDGVPEPTQALTVVRTLAARGTDARRILTTACREAGVESQRYRELERRVWQVGERLLLEVAVRDGEAQVRTLERLVDETFLHAVDGPALATSVGALRDALALAEGVARGEAQAEEQLRAHVGEGFDAASDATVKLERRLARQLAKRDELVRTLTLHGGDSEAARRLLVRAEREAAKLEARLAAARADRERIVDGAGDAAIRATKEASSSAGAARLPATRAALDEVAGDLSDPARASEAAAALRGRSAEVTADLRARVRALETRLAEPAMQQAARDRPAVVAAVPEIGDFARILPDVASAVLGELGPAVPAGPAAAPSPAGAPGP